MLLWNNILRPARLIAISTFTLCTITAYGKNISGIYHTAHDYEHDQLTYVCDCTNQVSKIRLRDFFGNTPSLKIITQGKKYTLRKNEVFGYKDCNNNSYRFYNNVTYRIAEAGNIFIYIQEKNITQSKGYKVVNEYYFSTTAESNLIPLTIDNLKNAYSSNEEFTNLLTQFLSNGNIYSYDAIHKTFTINYLYSKAIK